MASTPGNGTGRSNRRPAPVEIGLAGLIRPAPHGSGTGISDGGRHPWKWDKQE